MRAFPVVAGAGLALAAALFVTAPCAAQSAPSAQLLLPHFEVGLPTTSEPSEALADTELAIASAAAHDVGVRIVVHTNWGIPVLETTTGLAPRARMTFLLGDWLLRGSLPDRQLEAAELAHLQAALSGLASPSDGLYYSSPTAPAIASGFVRIHQVYGGEPSADLWGEAILRDASGHLAAGWPLVDLSSGSRGGICRDHLALLAPDPDCWPEAQLLVWSPARYAPRATTDEPRHQTIDCGFRDAAGALLAERRLNALPLEVIALADFGLPGPPAWVHCVARGEPVFTSVIENEPGAWRARYPTLCSAPETPPEARPALRLLLRVARLDADSDPGPAFPVGTELLWRYEVENTGSLALSEVAVRDRLGRPVVCPRTELAPGESMTCETVEPALACEQQVRGTATALDPDGVAVDAEDRALYTGLHHAALAIEKRIADADADEPPGPTLQVGAAASWTFAVTNTGDVELIDVAVSDDRDLAVTCPRDRLSPRETMTCSAGSTAVAGLQRNAAEVVGTPPCGPPTSASDVAHYTGHVPQPAISLQKLVNGEDANAPPGPTIDLGTPVAWQYQVGNPGELALAGIAVTDNRGVVVSCPKTTLAPGESMTCTGAGAAVVCQYQNLGTASATAGGTPVSVSDPAHYFGRHHAALTLETRCEGDPADTSPGPTLRSGGVVHWTYEVANVGDVQLSSVLVSEDRGAVVSCPKSTLAAGETMTCTATGTVQPGPFRNVGTVAGEPPCGDLVAASDPSHYVGISPAMSLEKLVNGLDADAAPGPTLLAGSPVLWTYVVTNSGDVTLATVGVIDDRGVAVTCPKSTLAPGESMSCTGSGSVAAGDYVNVGTVTGTPPDGSPSVTASDPSHCYGVFAQVAIEKRTNGNDADTPPGPSLQSGSTVAWTYLVTNTGTVALDQVGVTDDRNVAVTCPKTTLVPGEQMTCTASGTAVLGQYANLGTVTGTPSVEGLLPVSASDSSHYFGFVFNQGCMPGYWKYHTSSWPPTGYSTGQTVLSVFSQAFRYPALGSSSLLEALNFDGGPGTEGAAEILLRAAVAALLNAAHPDVAYPRTPDNVIATVNDALAAQNRDPMLALAASLDADNNLGCPLH